MQTQSLGVISINLWQVLISLANLALLFLMFKRFLFKPVKKVLADRQANLDGQYAAAREAQEKADADKAAWAEKMQTAQAQADALVAEAAESARRSADSVVAQAKERATGIVREAEEEARLEHQKAQAGIRRELADVSAELAEKLLEREINTRDHKALIDSFIEELGDGRDGDQ